jgi:hypothetical protein
VIALEAKVRSLEQQLGRTAQNDILFSHSIPLLEDNSRSKNDVTSHSEIAGIQSTPLRLSASPLATPQSPSPATSMSQMTLRLEPKLTERYEPSTHPFVDQGSGDRIAGSSYQVSDAIHPASYTQSKDLGTAPSTYDGFNIDAPITDGMVAYCHRQPTSEGDMSFDDSSTFNFAMNLKESTAGSNTQDSSKGGDLGISKGQQSRRSRASKGARYPGYDTSIAKRTGENEDISALRLYLGPNAFVHLPQRYMADTLLETYFARAYPMMPFLIETNVRKQYEKLWSVDTPTTHAPRVLMYSIFAIGCQFRVQDENNVILADTMDLGNWCYKLSRGFVLANAFNNVSIGMLQIILLVVLYEQGINRANQCWLTVGWAIRMALGMGLHKKLPANSDLLPLERELRNRLWWGCFAFDR